MTNDHNDRKASTDTEKPVDCQDEENTVEEESIQEAEDSGVSKSLEPSDNGSDFEAGNGGVQGDDNEDNEAEDNEQAQIEALKDKLLRALAETENVRKRADREREEVAKYGITSLARDIVGIADNLRRALESVPAESKESDARIKSLREGVALTQQEFEAVLARHGIERIEPLGELFDHNFHQAMFEIEDKEHSAGTVVQVLQEGYRIHDRLLRPAMVGVAKKTSAPTES
ncbi:MAG TPA: nucleotide exchange factor GrpE [Alphaproteobacteria bacterium]|jgi:molecular chaperone GrpE|nr:MAG: Protein GrpE [Alphaproteobacteria bacterium MarineAlpha9_Bin5]PPR35872.1 MAG: Protein GrpE [Alphaproteobacteria bacterium MarineAlpha9_Bin6]HIA21628.1 nucleotide exchange factor GrpE [Alphaproteobacteria bacterium]HIC71448.1 nucleotide exchange factor GrpE [Alphaproteobacteria bacterium]HIM71747.1 nucleotide exchange factor GrpE [Alphaproteobacteria bacterium]